MRWIVGVVVIAVAAVVARGAPQRVVNPKTQPGWAIYERQCEPCHGAAGEGRGPAAPYTRSAPRDLVGGALKWGGARAEIANTIRWGAPGTSMPASPLADGDIEALVDVVLALRGGTQTASSALPVAPATNAAERGGALWTTLGCATCHGASGRGDGTITPSPYDLTAEPLHRPRADDTLASRRAAVARTILGGVPGTAMPAFTLADADLWALADYAVALNTYARDARPVMSSRAIDQDRDDRIEVATWPGRDDGDSAAIFGGAIPPQGDVPATLAPAEASLAPRQCARCHAKQYAEWSTSLHHGAASPGLAAQMAGITPATAAKCLRCHAPLAEQLTDETLRADGASCAGCHVRGWTRHGPRNVAPSLIASPSYPLVTQPLYERADFCLPCHQLPPRTAVAGKPLLDTYREWLEGPYAPRGIQCQHCHMPNRDHSVKGIHDAETFRQAISLTGRATREGNAITIAADLANIGAGHMLPTTTTPAVILSITLFDADGLPIPGGTATKRIGRDVFHSPTDKQWHENTDTRIAPGGHAQLAWKWWGGRYATAVRATLFVEVSPDDYYERLYVSRLTESLTIARRTRYQEALARARADHYVATTLDLALP